SAVGPVYTERYEPYRSLNQSLYLTQPKSSDFKHDALLRTFVDSVRGVLGSESLRLKGGGGRGVGD
ncbi:hypothetical protein BHE74_00035285, partial [Ensete ventricosum]